MAPKTTQEQSLDALYELRRKKKEERALAKQHASAGVGSGSGAAARPSAVMAAGRSTGTAPAAAVSAAATAPALIPGETPMERAKRMMAAKLAHSSGSGNQHPPLVPAPAAAAAAGSPSSAGSAPSGGRKVTLKLKQPGGGGLEGGRPAVTAGGERRPAAEPRDVARAAMAAHQGQMQAPSAAARKAPSSAAAALRRPAVRRPSTQRVAPSTGQASAKRSRTEEEPQQRIHDYEANRQAATLFVGDLPPMTISEDLADLFNQFAPVVEAKVIGSQCYAFLTFQDQATALRVQQESNMRVQFKGRTLRVNRAMGDMPSWQRGPTRAAPGGGAALGGGDALHEHPKIREVRMEAQAQADDVDSAELLSMNLRPPPERELVVYDDI